MGASADFPGNKSNILRVVSTTGGNTLNKVKDNAADTTKDFWRGVKDWFGGLGKRFDDFQTMRGSFHDILFSTRNEKAKPQDERARFM